MCQSIVVNGPMVNSISRIWIQDQHIQTADRPMFLFLSVPASSRVARRVAFPAVCHGRMSSSAGTADKTWGPYDEGPISIESRFTCQGRERQDMVWKIYVQRDSMQSPLYNSSGTPALHSTPTHLIGWLWWPWCLLPLLASIVAAYGRK